MKTLYLKIAGMTCSGCARTIEKQLDVREGIHSASVDYEALEGYVTYDEDIIEVSDVVETINGIGHYKVVSYEDVTNVDKNTERHLIIIGGGSAAFAAAIEAKEHGAEVTMINEGLPIGGTCVNVGCVPSKNLIRAAETLHKANNNPFKGIESSAKVSDFQQIIEGKSALVEALRQQKYIDIIQDIEGFELIEGRAALLSATSVQVGERVIEGSHILIATGASPLIPDIDGLKSVDYLSNEEAFALETLPDSVIILGGSYIALEMAQLFARLGSSVTVLQRSERILSTEQQDITDALTGYLEAEGLEIVTGNTLQNVRQDASGVAVTSVVDGQERVFRAEKLIVATGRKPNTADLQLETAGVTLNAKGGIKVNAFMQTSVPTIFAAGDVTGERMFVYTAAYGAKLAVDNMFTPQQQAADFSVLPWVIFTDPQVAGVGLDEAQAVAKGIDYDVALLPLDYVPRAIAAQDTRGFIKLLRNREDDTLIGARILAPEGSELLMEVAVAIRFGITSSALKEMLHPYLTMAEGIKLAAITFDKDVSSLSCCAT